MLAGDLINKALDVWAQPGKYWVSGAIDDTFGGHCAMGALNLADHGSAQYELRVESAEYKQALDALIRNIVPDEAWEKEGIYNDYDRGPCAIARYNNTRRSFSEIQTWFEKAAADEGHSLDAVDGS